VLPVLLTDDGQTCRQLPLYQKKNSCSTAKESSARPSACDDVSTVFASWPAHLLILEYVNRT